MHIEYETCTLKEDNSAAAESFLLPVLILLGIGITGMGLQD